MISRPKTEREKKALDLALATNEITVDEYLRLMNEPSSKRSGRPSVHGSAAARTAAWRAKSEEFRHGNTMCVIDRVPVPISPIPLTEKAKTMTSEEALWEDRLRQLGLAMSAGSEGMTGGNDLRKLEFMQAEYENAASGRRVKAANFKLTKDVLSVGENPGVDNDGPRSLAPIRSAVFGQSRKMVRDAASGKLYRRKSS
jgi:hypothetical protein